MPDGVGKLLFQISVSVSIWRQPFRGHRPVDLEPAQVVEERALAREQAVGFRLQRPQPFCGALAMRLALMPRALVRVPRPDGRRRRR